MGQPPSPDGVCALCLCRRSWTHASFTMAGFGALGFRLGTGTCSACHARLAAHEEQEWPQGHARREGAAGGMALKQHACMGGRPDARAAVVLL